MTKKNETENIEKKESTTPAEEVVEKVGFLKRAWKTIVTGVTCAAVGVGVTLGADALMVQESITKAQAKQVAIAAAAYSAEEVLSKVTTIATAEKKAEAIKEAIDATTAAIPKMIEGVTAVKEGTKEASQNITDAVEKAKKDQEETGAVAPTTKTTDTTKTTVATANKAKTDTKVKK